MLGISPFRLFTTITLALVVGALAHELGAPWEAALVAALGGLTIGFIGIMAGRPDDPPPVAPLADDPPVEVAPTLDELIDAIDDPCLLVVSRRVTRANPAALELLGRHIIGEDVRLAIRHPAAAERLSGDFPHGDPGERTAIELVGIGERDRRWELVIHELSNNARFVRLADRSRTYAAEQMRVDFVANASHELRTPLAALLGYIETLQDPGAEDAETRTRFLGIMQDQAVRMQRLINDLISLSRIEGEKYRLPGDEIDLNPLVIEAAEAAVVSLGREPDSIIVASAHGLPPIAGDRAQLSQLVNNLVGNALKYGRPEIPVEISLEARPDSMIRLVVMDHGEGVAPEHLPRLTERFYRVDPSRSRAMGGTGLGLAIVKHIVERHRGRLNIESKVGRGTKVTVDLPAHHGQLSSHRNDVVTQIPTRAIRTALDPS